MTSDNSLDGCQSNAGARELGGLVQSLERAEQHLGVSHVKSNTVVSNEERCLAVLNRPADRYARFGARPGKLHGVAEQVGQRNFQQARIAKSLQTRFDAELQRPAGVRLP